MLRVWNTGTGKFAEEVAKNAGPASGSLAFTSDSKRLVTFTTTEYAEWDIATGKKEAGWKRGLGGGWYGGLVWGPGSAPDLAPLVQFPVFARQLAGLLVHQIGVNKGLEVAIKHAEMDRVLKETSRGDLQ